MPPVLDRLRVAARTLRKQPVFTAVVVLSLGLAIALNTTMYGVLDALVHPRTDVRDPAHLFWIRYFGDYRIIDNAARDRALREGAPALERTAYITPWLTQGLLEHGQNGTERAIAGVGLEFFSLLDARLVAGRTFVAADEHAEVTPIVINEQLAGALFPGEPNVVGERIKFGDTTFAVIGVLSKYTKLPELECDAFILSAPPERRAYIRAARLRPDVDRAVVERQLDRVSRRLALAAGIPPRDVAFRLKYFTDSEYHYQGFHVAVVLAVATILLIACANVANMQLARGIGRRRELALRSALGASRRRIIAHLLLESVLLATTGLVLGILLTSWATVGMHAVIPPSIGKLVVEPRWSWRVFAIAIAATISTIVLVGVGPSIVVSRVDPNELLKSGAGTGATRRQRRQYGYLVVVEMALALALLSAALVLMHTSTLMADDAADGFDVAPLALANLIDPIAVGQKMALNTLMSGAVSRARATPGVANATAEYDKPVTGDSITIADSASGLRAIAAPQRAATIVSPSYLRTLDLPLVAGRDFIEGERDVQVALVDDYTAMSLWPNANPIGALIKMGTPASDAAYVRVIGVFGYRGRRMKQRYEMAEVNGMRMGRVLMLPSPRDSIAGAKQPFRLRLSVRSSTADATKLPLALRRAGFSSAATYDDAMGMARTRQSMSFIMALFFGFAGFALCLAAFGVYGIVAHSVAERRRELGVRIALGATSRDILHAVLRESVVIGLAGIASGLALIKCVESAADGSIFDDALTGTVVFAGAALLLLATTALSAFVPALRATRVDPTESLRSE